MLHVITALIPAFSRLLCVRQVLKGKLLEIEVVECLQCIFHNLTQCFSTFFYFLWNPTQAWRSLMEPHAHWFVSLAEYRPTGEVEVSGCLGTEAENLWGSESKAQKADDN